jgi:enoyl-CoA hydratase
MSEANTPPAAENLRCALHGAVLHIELYRPQRVNALSRALLLELESVLDWAEAADPVRAIVVSGSGNGFSSGFDLKDQMAQRPEGPVVWKEILELDYRVTMRFWHCPKPTIAAVHGPCLAGAFELALACDYTIADEGAVFGEPELRFGAGIVTMLLPWITGPKQAKRIILSGLDDISAREALAMGIVSQVVASGGYLAEALRIARNLAAIDPVLVMQTKKAINRTYEIQGLRAALESALEIDHSIESHGSPDKRQFMQIARESGLRSALDWRDSRFDPGPADAQAVDRNKA